MSEINNALNEEIIVIVCEDHNEEYHTFPLPKPIRAGSLDYQEDILVAGNLAIPYKWFKTVFVCTEEMYSIVQETVLNA